MSATRNRRAARELLSVTDKRGIKAALVEKPSNSACRFFSSRLLEEEFTLPVVQSGTHNRNPIVQRCKDELVKLFFKVSSFIFLKFLKI